MNDFMLYCFMGLIVMFIIYSILRSQSSSGANPDNRDFRIRGNERPRYDDPDVEGRGSFGRDASNSGWDDVRRKTTGNSTANRPTNNSPKVTGRGSFGNDKR